MYLGIEIGGTKLQVGVGRGDGGQLIELARLNVDPSQGAEGILRQIQKTAADLLPRHEVSAIGIGFGGPVDRTAGRTVTSHQIDGWDGFPLVAWCRDKFALPAGIANDTDTGGLAEALFGAGRGKKVVVYSNVGSGIGGALIVDGQIFCQGDRISAEIGHLRPGPKADTPEATVESVASGWAIAKAAQTVLRCPELGTPEAVADLSRRCNGQIDRLTTADVARAAGDGNKIAQQLFARAVKTYGWALAQVITLLAPDVVVVGGGVSLAGEQLFFAPLRQAIDRYVFPPQLGRFQVVPAVLGEEIVVHGALALAAKVLC